MRLLPHFIGVLMVGVAPALAGENDAIEARNCRPSMDQWVEHEAAGGAKILKTHLQAGAIGVFTIRWNNGAEQVVTVMPATDPDGRAAVCVVARETLKSAGQANLSSNASDPG